MNVFLARQPIFDLDEKVYAYEMLYRSGDVNRFSDTSGDTASARVMIDTFQTFGIEVLTNNKPAFINFTDKLIKDEIATLFSKEYLVVEILETVKLDEEIICKCIELKQKGYTLALDDFVCREEYRPLIKITDIIKVDFRETKRVEIEKMISKLKSFNIEFLAEKVETREEFEYAKNLGFSLFQGYFFQKPEIMTSSGLSPLKLTYLQLMNEVNKNEINFEKLSTLISRDLALTYNLLRIINSAAFAYKSVTSVKQALVILGEKEVRKWVNLMALKGLGDNKPNELVKSSLIRASFGELIAEKVNYKQKANDLFLVGLFSLIDVILQRPLGEILVEIMPPKAVQEALIDQTGELADVYKIILCYEKGSLEDIVHEMQKLKISSEDLVNLYINSLLCYDSLTREA
ncbi:EAL and modified HD-GYP domain-containing signal transduction protein [Desulfonispora thiosulfatigenes DSM 11270]|uniref:EAL and modified HD-GYP domain-containing signal transduction protein n=1 Tax=Desulfonispora thiosulfatigenes DSM 11270 TaxID=656914 RepID=A0A1W1V152_DESTI|nr:HDOD domain-containing protein [Desulfonispora thiosulfatigenes]SMB87053.1 EAL and modified HD-GYP domain-containing signal transduction protein [Desulfonispora thiosulfatigenes DSM 11270]